jgi:hypothetical protein
MRPNIRQDGCRVRGARGRRRAQNRTQIAHGNGNPYRRTRGLLGDFETIVASQEQAKAERKTISRRVTFLSNVSLVQSIVLFLIVMLVVGIIVYLGQIQLTPKLPTSGVHSPYETAVDYESGVTNNGLFPRNNEVS